MRTLRMVSLFVFVMAMTAVAEAQCLKCFREPGKPLTQGTCGESFDGYCDRQCCGNVQGAPCSIPDFLDDCDWWLSASLLQRPAVETAAQPYFATRRPLENRTATLHRRLQTLDPAAPKCGART